jgi:hypothetical protein
VVLQIAQTRSRDQSELCPVVLALHGGPVCPPEVSVQGTYDPRSLAGGGPSVPQQEGLGSGGGFCRGSGGALGGVGWLYDDRDTTSPPTPPC